MPDREKVIKGLKCLAQKQEPTSNPCKDCGYINRPNFAICVKDVASDALALLKEQETVPPEVDSEGTCSCGNCGETVGYFPVGFRTPEKLCKYCPECGRKVKWNEY